MPAPRSLCWFLVICAGTRIPLVVAFPADNHQTGEAAGPGAKICDRANSA